MPRQGRIDAPGAVHHITVRGIERRKIFLDDQDRSDFIKRLGDLVLETQTQCLAWALIPNHFHLLLRTGNTPIATLMRRLLTGYAIVFNRRHRRSGHLFQNRYKSILCEEDAYLKELVRYIHLNPLRAKVIKDLMELDRYRFSGHSCLIGKDKNEWQAIGRVLSFFSARPSLARRRYREYVEKGLAQGRRPELVGGGLIRSVGGWAAVRSMRKAGVSLKSDERILGGSDFVAQVLAEAQEAMDNKDALAAKGVGLDEIVAVASRLLGVKPQALIGAGKERRIVKARQLACHWAVGELGLSMTEVAKRLSISVSTVSVAVKSGRGIVAGEELVLADLLNIET